MTMAGEGLLEFVRVALDRGVELQTPLGLIGAGDSAS
jgi:hypothetical protein